MQLGADRVEGHIDDRGVEHGHDAARHEYAGGYPRVRGRGRRTVGNDRHCYSNADANTVESFSRSPAVLTIPVRRPYRIEPKLGSPAGAVRTTQTGRVGRAW